MSGSVISSERKAELLAEAVALATADFRKGVATPAPFYHTLIYEEKHEFWVFYSLASGAWKQAARDARRGVMRSTAFG